MSGVSVFDNRNSNEVGLLITYIYNIEFHVQNKLTMSIVICNTKEFAIVTSRQLVGNSQVRYQIYLHL